MTFIASMLGILTGLVLLSLIALLIFNKVLRQFQNELQSLKWSIKTDWQIVIAMANYFPDKNIVERHARIIAKILDDIQTLNDKLSLSALIQPQSKKTKKG